MLSDLDIAALEAAARQFEANRERAEFATPGDLAKAIDPRTVQTPALDLIDTELQRVLSEPGGRLIISLPPQQGKALALDTPVPTPTGWSTMGALKVGDQVMGGDGRPCRVTWVSPIWTGRDCYAVTTGDGERIVADGAHEWVARLDRRSAPRVVDTVKLAAPRSKNAQITAPPGGLAELPDADLPLDPYVFGVWLGDGNSSGPIITCHPGDVAIRDRIAEAGWPLKHQGKMRWSMIPAGWVNRGARHPSPAKVALRATGALGSKHIPMAYLRASRAQRLALLQGLIDSDGYVAPDGQVEFCATRRVLAEGVRELVYSLGGKAVMSEGRATIAGRDCGTKYRVRFYLANAAHLPRKAERCRDSSVASVRYVKAEPCASVHTVCIEVDSPDHMFLAGRTMLPTHNSTRAAQIFPVWALQQDPDRPVIVASYGEQLAERNGEIIRDHIAWNSDLLGINVGQGSSAKKRWKIEGHRGGVLSAGIGSGMTGWASGLTIIDDPIKDQSEADSQTYRDKVWNWWLSVAQTRLAPGAPVVLILTRWHTDDLAGRLLAADDGHRWRVVNIPALADHDPAKGETDPLGREPGEYLETARLIRDRASGIERPMTKAETIDYWEAIRVGVGSRVWNALYQGRPSPAAGGIFQREWLESNRYHQPMWVDREDGSKVTTNPGDELLISADFAFKDTASSDYVAIGVWLRRGIDVYLLDQVHDRLDFIASRNALRNLAARWPQATIKLVEDKANGTAVIRSLAQLVPGIVPEEPKGGKVERANAVAPFWEAGNAHLPSPELAPWVGDYIDEHAAFPNGSHDDQVDQSTQAINRLLLQPILAGESLVPDDFDALDERGYVYSPY